MTIRSLIFVIFLVIAHSISSLQVPTSASYWPTHQSSPYIYNDYYWQNQQLNWQNLQLKAKIRALEKKQGCLEHLVYVVDDRFDRINTIVPYVAGGMIIAITIALIVIVLMPDNSKTDDSNSESEQKE